jgi:aminopeptidase N
VPDAPGRHFAHFVDPHPKPCYLFAVVAASLGVLEDVYVTASGRRVRLRVFAAHKDLPFCGHAMQSLKVWDHPCPCAWVERGKGCACVMCVRR